MSFSAPANTAPVVNVTSAPAAVTVNPSATVQNNVTATTPANLTVKNLFGANPYGAGYDGALSIIAPTTCTRDLQCTNLTVAPANGLLSLDECTFTNGIGSWTWFDTGVASYLSTGATSWDQGVPGYLSPNCLRGDFRGTGTGTPTVTMATGTKTVTPGDYLAAAVLVRNPDSVQSVTVTLGFATMVGSPLYAGIQSSYASVTVGPGQSVWLTTNTASGGTPSPWKVPAGDTQVALALSLTPTYIGVAFPLEILYAAMIQDTSSALSAPLASLTTAGFRIVGTGALDVSGIVANDGTAGNGSVAGAGAPAGSLAGGAPGGGSAPVAASVQGGAGGGGAATVANPLIILDTQALTAKTYSGGGGGASYGGGGGGVIFLAFPTMSLTGVVRALGGNSSTSYAGGGGGGGVVLLVYTSRIGQSPNVSGGAGYSTGLPGAPGSVGEVVV